MIDRDINFGRDSNSDLLFFFKDFILQPGAILLFVQLPALLVEFPIKRYHGVVFELNGFEKFLLLSINLIFFFVFLLQLVGLIYTVLLVG